MRAGASAIGFNFYPESSRFRLAQTSSNLSASLVPPSVARVGIFVDATSEQLLETLDRVPLDVLQLHGSIPDSLPLGVRIWRALPVTPQFRVSALGSEFEAYLLDSPTPQYGGSAKPLTQARRAPRKRSHCSGGRPECSECRPRH